MPTQAVSSTHKYSALSSFDFYEPEVWNELIKTHGDQFLTSLHILRTMGMRQEAKQDEVYHYEDRWIHENFTVKTNVGDPGAGNSALITLSATDVDSNNNFYPKVGHIVLFNNDVPGRIMSIDVSTPTAPVLTVEPISSTDNIDALTAGDTIIIVSSGFGAGTGNPDPSLRGTDKRTSVCQIFKETVAAYGSELTRATWFKKYDTGGNIVGYYSTAMGDISYRIALQIDGAFWTGKLATNAAMVDTNGETIKTTKGVFPTVNDLGNTVNYTPGTFVVTDFDEFDRILTKEGVSSEDILMLTGLNFHQELENTMVNFTKDTAVDYTRSVSKLFGGSDAKALSIGFSQIHKSGRSYLLKPMRSWSHPKYLGAEGYDYNSRAVIVPLDKPKDAKSGERSHRLTNLYRKLGTYSREMETFNISGAGEGTFVTDLDQRKDCLRSHQGLKIAKANGIIVVKKS